MADLIIPLHAARAINRLSQVEIARKMGVTKQTVINWENGTHVPKPAQLKMYCDICGVSVDDVFLPSKSS